MNKTTEFRNWKKICQEKAFLFMEASTGIHIIPKKFSEVQLEMNFLVNGNESYQK